MADRPKGRIPKSVTMDMFPQSSFVELTSSHSRAQSELNPLFGMERLLSKSMTMKSMRMVHKQTESLHDDLAAFRVAKRLAGTWIKEGVRMAPQLDKKCMC